MKKIWLHTSNSTYSSWNFRKKLSWMWSSISQTQNNNHFQRSRRRIAVVFFVGRLLWNGVVGIISTNQNNWRFHWKWQFWYAQVFCLVFCLFNSDTFEALYIFRGGSNREVAGGFICCFLMRHGEYGDVLANFSSCQGKN